MTVSVVADDLDGEDILIWNQCDMKCALTIEDILASDWEVVWRRQIDIGTARDLINRAGG